MSGDHPKYSSSEIGQNIEKSPRDFRKLAVIQTLVKDHQLPLMKKKQKTTKLSQCNINNNDKNNNNPL